MIVKELANYPPWSYRPKYCRPIRHPGDTRIVLRDVSGPEKEGLEQLMDELFVTNELLGEELYLSHEPDSAVKRWARQLPFGSRFFDEPGLKKAKQDAAGGGYVISYESGRSGNPYPDITLDSDRYRAYMSVEPVEEITPMSIPLVAASPAGRVHIGVHLHREEYGAMLINEIVSRFDPGFSDELKERKERNGRYEKRSVHE